MNSPQRTCVVCGRKADQAELLRLGTDNGEMIPDPGRLMPGRGAYICKTSRCAADLAEGKMQGRGLKRRPDKAERERLSRLINQCLG